eukprot:3206266-Pleurochrysis_carterae.AAC.3
MDGERPCRDDERPCRSDELTCRGDAAGNARSRLRKWQIRKRACNFITHACDIACACFFVKSGRKPRRSPKFQEEAERQAPSSLKQKASGVVKQRRGEERGATGSVWR